CDNRETEADLEGAYQWRYLRGFRPKRESSCQCWDRRKGITMEPAVSTAIEVNTGYRNARLLSKLFAGWAPARLWKRMVVDWHLGRPPEKENRRTGCTCTSGFTCRFLTGWDSPPI